MTGPTLIAQFSQIVAEVCGKPISWLNSDPLTDAELDEIDAQTHRLLVREMSRKGESET